MARWWANEEPLVVALFDKAVLSAEAMLQQPQVGPDATLSHVGFRTVTQDEWKALLKAVEKHGERVSTRKDDGREVVFIKLDRLLNGERATVDYLEFPQPDEVVNIGKKPTVVAFTDHTLEFPVKQDVGDVELRISDKHVRDYIEAAKGQEKDK